MSSGTLLALYTAPTAGAPMQRRPAVEALEGRGLAGDRYALGVGSFSRWPGPARDITLVSAEALRAAEKAFGVRLLSGEHRRNLVVENLDLAALVRATFRIGEVELRGERVCAPCRYLVRVTGQPDIFEALLGRGGLRARVVRGGTLREGDTVVVTAGGTAGVKAV